MDIDTLDYSAHAEKTQSRYTFIFITFAQGLSLFCCAKRSLILWSPRFHEVMDVNMRLQEAAFLALTLVSWQVKAIKLSTL
jgi:hypothetical protein